MSNYRPCDGEGQTRRDAGIVDNPTPPAQDPMFSPPPPSNVDDEIDALKDAFGG